MNGIRNDDAFQRAIALISEHPSVDAVATPPTVVQSGETTVDATFRVNLPSKWRRKGESPTGVRSQEVVRFEFSSGYPLDPPKLSLREDFSRNFPHIQPWTTDGRPVPCICDGNMGEFLHQYGLAEILNQTARWLDNAARNRLIDPEQGWEPVRRDSLHEFIVADADYLQGLVDRGGGRKFLKFIYIMFNGSDGRRFYRGRILNELLKVNPKIIKQFFHKKELNGDTGFSIGTSLALVSWPGKCPSGTVIVSDSYLPETVETIDDLIKSATNYGCAQEVRNGMDRLKNCFSGKEITGPVLIPIVLLVRRPFHLIGSESTFEICPYMIEIQSPSLQFMEGATVVRPTAHRHAISRSLLAKMAGATVHDQQSWTLVGAGSLGSKLAIHLARAGNGPNVLVDQSIMSPHNAARHALLPATCDLQTQWMENKATSLARALIGLDQTASALVEDVAVIAKGRSRANGAWSKNSWAIVNSTASLRVREAFGSCKWDRPRVIEASIFSEGCIGVVTVEGPRRNPSTTDLMADLYGILKKDSELSSVFFQNGAMMTRQDTGHGCSSLTMTLSDGRISLFAAGIAECLLNRQTNGLPDDCGEVLVGRILDDGLSVVWKTEQIPPVTVIKAKCGSPWSVHLHHRAISKMEEVANRWTNLETGGVLMGRLSEVSRIAHVVDVLDAPEDSERSVDQFILGKQGLLQRIQDYSTAVGGSLYCLGTWHNHLSPSGPSPTDWDTAKKVSLAQLTPSISVIMTPEGFEALAVDMSDSAVLSADISAATI